MKRFVATTTLTPAARCSRFGVLGRCPVMSERSSKTFDCVQSMRQARDKLSAEIEGMSYDELVRWLRSHRYTDPVLRRLAEKAARQAGATDRAPGGC